MADFKQMAMDAYNQRNNQNVCNYVYNLFLINMKTNFLAREEISVSCFL